MTYPSLTAPLRLSGCRVRLIRPGHLIVDDATEVPTSGPVLVSRGVRPESRPAALFRAVAPGLPVYLAGQAAGSGGSLDVALRGAASAAATVLND